MPPPPKPGWPIERGVGIFSGGPKIWYSVLLLGSYFSRGVLTNSYSTTKRTPKAAHNFPQEDFPSSSVWSHFLLFFPNLCGWSFVSSCWRCVSSTPLSPPSSPCPPPSDHVPRIMSSDHVPQSMSLRSCPSDHVPQTMSLRPCPSDHVPSDHVFRSCPSDHVPQKSSDHVPQIMSLSWRYGYRAAPNVRLLDANGIAQLALGLQSVPKCPPP